ncbi:MAG: hypothetical protein ILM98_14075 [Kiritimatiellae bacterium]|nr:hypothetical protein [Kiritimatiellia bacterium]
MAKWPFTADGETVRDYHGEFVAACSNESVARLLAAPLLYLHWKSTRLDNKAMADSYAEQVESALKGWKP